MFLFERSKSLKISSPMLPMMSYFAPCSLWLSNIFNFMNSCGLLVPQEIAGTDTHLPVSVLMTPNPAESVAGGGTCPGGSVATRKLL